MVKLEYSPKVEKAIQNDDPIVALESTIITHGMPWPDNFKTAQEVEKVITETGATPATIAVINGVIKVGLEEEILSNLSKTKNVRKLSRADLAHCLLNKDVGKDATRFIMLNRSSDVELDFDFDAVKEKSKDNPLYYVQYCYARISSVFRHIDKDLNSNIELDDFSFEY